MELTTRMLAQFVVVAQEEHVGRAAERLSISQPPLTQAVQRLERAVGVPLLERTGRGVRLTAAGRSFATDASAILAAQSAAVDRARRMAGGLAGTVRVGYIGSLAFAFVPRVLRAAGHALPELDLQLRQEPSDALLAALARRELDVAVVRAASVHDDGVDVRRVHGERLRLAVPADHRLARRRRVRMAELEHVPFVSFGDPRGASEMSDALRMACADAGFAPRVVAEAVDLPGLLAWVIAGRAIALVPEGAASVATDDVVLLDVVGGPHLSIVFVAATLPDHDPAVDRLLDVMTSV